MAAIHRLGPAAHNPPLHPLRLPLTQQQITALIVFNNRLANRVDVPYRATLSLMSFVLHIVRWNIGSIQRLEQYIPLQMRGN